MPVGTKCIEALKMLQKEYAWAVDLEICAFAQEGLANVPEADKALVEALEMGATSIGGAPNYDTDHPAHINRVFELAREYDIHVDMHIDSGHDPAAMDNMLVADLTEKYKYGGRVAMGHMTKVAALPPAKQKDIAKRLRRRRRRRSRCCRRPICSCWRGTATTTCRAASPMPTCLPSKAATARSRPTTSSIRSRRSATAR